MRTRVMLTLALLLFLFPLNKLVQAQTAGITLSVDATEAPRKILHAKEILSAREGMLTLYYPKWIPGEHGPTGPVVDFVGLKIQASGKPVAWRRNLDDMYAIDCAVPAGTTELDLSFDFILPPVAEGFSSGASSTDKLLVLSWNQVVLYPKNIRPDSVRVNARLRIPEGWKFGSALETQSEAGYDIVFKETSLNQLVDSPVLTGKFFKRLDIGTVAGAAHHLNMVSDGDEALQMPAELVESYRQLVRETNALFGAHHFNHYDFLYTLSDNTAHFGLEHHQSSDNRIAERGFLDQKVRVTYAGLLPHEFVHSWNGKYRRPSGLATGDFSTPMRGDLLWVYEGLTQYLGNILTARSGLRTPEEYREHLAMTAAALDNRPGREWRPLQETADAAQILYDARRDWDSYRRGVDFYDEGNLIWLEADALIRQETKGKKSLDDFCKLFHGGENSAPQVKPYDFNDVTTTLNRVLQYDWSAWLTERLRSLAPHAPLGGIERAGWKLVYRDTASAVLTAYDESGKRIDKRFSLGVLFDEQGRMTDVIPGSPAAKAGLAPGMKLIAVNGRKFSKEILSDAIRSAKSNSSSLEFLAENVEYYKTYAIDYHGGERFPFLERDASKPDLLSAIIKPVSTGKAK